jgi:hypothetical protein
LYRGALFEMSQVKGTRIYLAFLPKHQVGTLMGFMR